MEHQNNPKSPNQDDPKATPQGETGAGETTPASETSDPSSAQESSERPPWPRMDSPENNGAGESSSAEGPEDAASASATDEKSDDSQEGDTAAGSGTGESQNEADVAATEGDPEGSQNKPPGFFKRMGAAMARPFVFSGRRIRYVWRKHSSTFFLLLLLLILLLVFLYPSMFITVHSGQAGVKWSRFFGGTVTSRVYGEGMHVIFPWDRIYIYNIRIQERAHEMRALTSDGLTVKIRLSVRYQPIREVVGALHKYVGEEYFKIIIQPEVEAIVRSTVGQYRPYDLVTTKLSIIQEIISESAKEIGERYLVMDDLLVREVELPREVQDAIEKKLKREQESLEFDYRLTVETKEAERKRIEAQGIRDFQRTVSEGISPDYLKWRGIRATEALAQSENAKIIVIGNGPEGLPVILNADK